MERAHDPAGAFPEGVVEGLLAWADAPTALGGLVLRAWAGTRRQRLLDVLRGVLCGPQTPGVPSGPDARAWLTLPHHSAAEQLDSGLDVGMSLAQGRPARRAGLLDRPVPPIVVVPMAERMPVSLAAALAGELDSGRLALILLDESLEDESGPWPGLLDRLALVIDLRDEAVLADVLALLEASAQSIDRCSAPPPGPELLPAQHEAIASAALLLDVASARPMLSAAALARALAGRRAAAAVDEGDLALAIRLALLPHARRLPQWSDSPPNPEPNDPPHDAQPDPPDDQPESPLDRPPDATPQEPPREDQAEGADQEEADRPLPDGAVERLVEAALATLPGDVLAELAGRSSRSNGRAGSAGAGLFTPRGRGRGRSVGARRGVPEGARRLHLFATLRAAIPWQRLRNHSDSLQAATDSGSGRPRLQLRKDDLHVHRELHRRGTTTVFVVDASGSTALQRLNEAKGAIELLLADCYVRRDRVALICFRGRGAELLLSPTRSLVAARRALVALPGGGGSPVAAGLELAIRVVSGLKRGGDDTQIVLLTDGRANLTRDGRPGRAEAAREAQALARQLAGLATHRVLIDTSLRSEPAAEQLARSLDARYCLMPFARAQAIRAAIG